VIGRGGFGVVFEAFDSELQRQVAFKVVRPRRGRRPAAQADWLRLEAMAAARLSHPNIVTLHDVGIDAGGPFLILERLHGETLQAWLDRGRPPVREAVRIAVEVARALAHAHEAGVIHRDLKPSNVFLTTSGAVKVLDFGLAQVLGSSDLPEGGTPAYMAPEQRRGEQADARTDLYSLGVILYSMLEGVLPYPADRDGAPGSRPGSPPPIRTGRVPGSLARMVGRMIAPDRGDRPGDVSSVLPVLERSLQILSRRAGRTWALAVGSLALVAAIGAGAWTLVRAPRAEPAARRTIALADVLNQTGEPELDGLSAFLSTSIEQSHSLAVLPRARVRELLGDGGGARRIDEPLAIRAASAAGAEAVLVPRVTHGGDRYTLEVRAIHPLSGSTLFTAKEVGTGRVSLPGLVDRVSARAREALREQGANVRGHQVRVAEAVTPNLEALRHFFSGKDCLERPARAGSWSSATGACLPDLRRAVELDPEFALAHYQIALATDDGYRVDGEARKAIAEALRHVDRAPPKDQGLIRAMAARLDGRETEALAIYDALLVEHPRDKDLLLRAAEGHFERAEYAAALPYLDLALEEDPTLEMAIALLPTTLGSLGRRDELRRRVEQWSRMAPSAPTFHAMADARLWLGDYPGAIEAARGEVAAGGGAAAEITLAAAHFTAGDLAESERVLGPIETAGALLRRAVVAGARRRLAAALSLAETYRQRFPDDFDSYHLMVGALLTGKGDAEGVLRETSLLRARSPQAVGQLTIALAYLGRLDEAANLRAGVSSWRTEEEVYQAMVEWRTGRPDAAKARLRALEETDPRPRGVPPPGFLHGEIAASLGQDAEAVEALRRYRAVPNVGIWQSWMQPRALYLLARSHHRLGKREQAVEYLGSLARQWEGADHDAPLQADVRALATELGITLNVP
jgi:tetratricopeptide (TPR) repeat protein